MDKTIFKHVKCGGIIDTRFIGGRRCLKCKKKWGPFRFMFTPDEIRPYKVRVPYDPMRARKPATYAKWGDRVGVGWVAERLPSWPRWARILTGIVLFSGVVYAFILFRRFVKGGA